MSDEVIKMSEIFDADQMDRITDFLSNKDANGLKRYLASMQSDLQKKNVLADYVFYVLCNNFNLKP